MTPADFCVFLLFCFTFTFTFILFILFAAFGPNK